MSACSFGGNWLSGEVFVLIAAAALALLLTPVLLAVLVGWSRGRQRGRPWQGALRGGAWMLAAYALLAAAWVALELVDMRRVQQESAQLQALVDAVRGVRPGGWGSRIDALDLGGQPESRRQSLAWEVLSHASLPLAWTDGDLQALDALAEDDTRVRDPGTRRALAGMVAFHRDGIAGFERVRAACDPASSCRLLLDDALNRHDHAIVAAAQQAQALWQAEPAAPPVRAALERMLARQRRAASDWGNRGDARLAFDRASRGALAAALEACGSEPQPPALAALDVSYCWSELLNGLEQHGSARLCPAGNGLDPSDLSSLRAWRTAWAEDSSRASRLDALIEDLAADCGR